MIKGVGYMAILEISCNLGRSDNCEVVILGVGLLGRSRNMGASLLCWGRIKVAVGLSRNRNVGGFDRESKVIVGVSLLCWDRIVGSSGRWNKVAVGLYRNRIVGSCGRESKVIVRVVVVNSPCLVILGGKVRGEVVILGASLL